MLTIRGHHLFDLLSALATGQSDHKTLGPVAQQIRAHPKTPIMVVIGVDDICSPCQWWCGQKGRCTRELTEHPEDNPSALVSDANALRALGLEPGDVLPADEIFGRIKARVDKHVFAEDVCVACRLVDDCRKTYSSLIDGTVRALAS